MFKTSLLALIAFTFSWSAAAQTNATMQDQGASQGTAATGSGGSLMVVLDKTIDAKKAKVGDQVEAKTTGAAHTASGVTIPEGSKLIGHVTEAKPREKGAANAQSSLGIAFDRVQVKGGQEIPIHAVIQALRAPQPAAMPAAPDMSAGPSGGYGQGGYGQGGYGGVGGVAPRTTNTTSIPQPTPRTTPVGAPGSTPPPNANGEDINPGMTGAVGMKDLRLESGGDAARGSIVTSDNKNVKLESGTQMLLRVTGQ
jgi:hypothetical protein